MIINKKGRYRIDLDIHRISSSELFSFVQGFVIRPGHENLVAMGAVDTIADDSIRKIHISLFCFLKGL